MEAASEGTLLRGESSKSCVGCWGLLPAGGGEQVQLQDSLLFGALGPPTSALPAPVLHGRDSRGEGVGGWVLRGFRVQAVMELLTAEWWGVSQAAQNLFTASEF